MQGIVNKSVKKIIAAEQNIFSFSSLTSTYFIFQFTLNVNGKNYDLSCFKIVRIEKTWIFHGRIAYLQVKGDKLALFLIKLVSGSLLSVKKTLVVIYLFQNEIHGIVDDIVVVICLWWAFKQEKLIRQYNYTNYQESSIVFFCHRLDCFFELVYGKMCGHDSLLMFETIDSGPWELADTKTVVRQKSKTLWNILFESCRQQCYY